MANVYQFGLGIGRGVRQFFIVAIPLVYLGVAVFFGALFWQQQDRFFASHLGNFLVQGRWQSDDTLRSLSDLRVDSRYGYFPLALPDAVSIEDLEGNLYYPEVIGYRVFDEEEFEVYFSQGLTLRFSSYEDGIAVDATQSEMPYQANRINISFLLQDSVTLLDEGLEVRLQVGSQNYAVEGDFDESRFDPEQSLMILQWVEELGFDRLNVSSNLFGQPRPFEQWLNDESIQSQRADRYENAIARYMGRAMPFFSARYNEGNGLWRSADNSFEFNVQATLTRVWQAASAGTLDALWPTFSEQGLTEHSEYPLWLRPWSGNLQPAWQRASAGFGASERLFGQQASSNSADLFSHRHLYTDLASAAPSQVVRVTGLARSVVATDTPAIIIYKVHFLLDALRNQNSNENLQGIQRQLEALEQHIVFLKRGIYLFNEEQILTKSMIDYAVLLAELERRDINIAYRTRRPIQAMRESLTLSALDFANLNGEIASYALWNNGRPQASESTIGFEYLYPLFNPTSDLPRVHLMSVGGVQRSLSVANSLSVRVLSETIVEMRLAYEQRRTHSLLLTNLIRHVRGVSVGSRRLTSSANLDLVGEGYSYDSATRTLFIKLAQSADVESIRIEIEPPPPPPPKEDADASEETTPAASESNDRRRR
jgi:hypothetical protein